MRVGKFSELKELWDLINQKLWLNIKINSEKVNSYQYSSRSCLEEKIDLLNQAFILALDRIYIHNDTAMSKSIISDDDNFHKTQHNELSRISW